MHTATSNIAEINKENININGKKYFIFVVNGCKLTKKVTRQGMSSMFHSGQNLLWIIKSLDGVHDYTHRKHLTATEIIVASAPSSLFSMST